LAKHKVGRTTGWTQGTIDTTCADVNVSGSDITLICQYHATAGQDFRDSGSPVFKITNSPSSGDVDLVGIAWGKDAAGRLWFSVLGTIIYGNELGSMAECASGFSC
jgi:hypothetical protein